MALKSIATFSAKWQPEANIGKIMLQRADGARYSINIWDQDEFDSVVGQLTEGPSIQFDTHTLDIRVHFQLVHHGTLRLQDSRPPRARMT